MNINFLLLSEMIESIIEQKQDVFNLITDLTEVRPSTIAGLGLFAKVFIPKGTIWWSGNSSNMLLIHREQYEEFEQSIIDASPLSGSLKKSFLVYCYYEKQSDALVLCLDNARFVNHSFTPNSGPTPDKHPFMAMTLRDIYPGEEIMEDYTSYDFCPWACNREDYMIRTE